MTKIEITDKIVLVEVPEGASDIHISVGNRLWYEVPDIIWGRKWGDDCPVMLPPQHTYSWAKKPGEISEEEAAELWLDSQKEYHQLDSYIVALLSLIRSKGMNPDNCIVVKINEKK